MQKLKQTPPTDMDTIKLGYAPTIDCMVWTGG